MNKLDYESPPPDASYEAWMRTKRKGFAHFLFFRGVLGWGAVMCAINYAALAAISLTLKPPRELFLIAPIWIAGGAAWAMLTWYLSERRYR